MTAAQFPVDGFFEAFVSLPDMGKAFGNRVKVHCFIQIFKLRIDAAGRIYLFEWERRFDRMPADRYPAGVVFKADPV